MPASGTGPCPEICTSIFIGISFPFQKGESDSLGSINRNLRLLVTKARAFLTHARYELLADAANTAESDLP